jgi:polyisoprenoid-binding protein YceI
MAASTAPAAFAQQDLSRIDPRHSTASIFLQGNGSDAPPLNAGIAMVSGRADWDRINAVNSDFHLYIYPAGQESALLDSNASFRKDGLANLARYTLLTFQSKSSSLDSNQKLVVTGDLTIIHVEREARADWSIAYSGAQVGDPFMHRQTRQVRLVIQDGSSASGAKWPAIRPDLVGSITTSDEQFHGIRKILVDSVWPIVVLDERCGPPAATASADMRGYQGANCSGTPVLPSTSGEIPAWSDQGYSGSKDPDPTAENRVTIVFNLRLIPEK